MQESRDQGIIIQLIIDYLWYDAHAFSVISESLIKLLGANQTRDRWNTWVTHLIRKIIKDSSIARSRCVSLMSLGEAFLRFSSSFSNLSSASTSAAFSSSSTGSVGLIFLDFTLCSAKLILNNILERRFTSVEVLPHTTLLAVVEQETGFTIQQ
jgi:hypothetical protein